MWSRRSDAIESLWRRLPAILLIGLCGAAACGRLPATVAPVPPVAYSVSELEHIIRTASPLPFTDGAALRTLGGDTIRGREAILDYFTAPPGSGHHSIYITTTEVYRCGPELGIQYGTYRAVLEGEGGHDRITSGRWVARWRGAAGSWQIGDGAFLQPAQGAPPVPASCIGRAEERFSTARLSFSGHLSAAGFIDQTPHDVLDRDGAGAVTTPGVLAGARYRLWKGLAVGGYLGSAPTRATTMFHTLHSKTSFRSLVVAYEGRNVALDVGPAWTETEWWWTNGATNRREGDDAFFSRRGALVSVHLMVPVYRQLSVDLIAQQRYFGSDRGLPRLDPELEAAQDHFFVGIGLAIAPGR